MAKVNLAKLIVKLEGESTKLQSELEKSNRSLNKFRKNTDKQLKGVGGSFKKFDKQIVGVSKSLKGFASVALAGVAISATGKKMFEAASSAESLMVALESVNGSSRLAQIEFKKLEDFAARTPNRFEEVVGAAIKLKARGLDPSIKSLESFGNTAAAMSKSLDQMAEAVADAVTGEFERLKEFGIKASSQGDKVQFTFKNVSKTVGKNSVEIQKYLESIGNTEFAGAMEKQSKTLNGVFSTLADNISIAARALSDKTGFTEALKSAATGFTKFLSALSGGGPTIEEATRKLEALEVARGLHKPGQGNRSRGADDQRIRDLKAYIQNIKIAGGDVDAITAKLEVYNGKIGTLQGRLDQIKQNSVLFDTPIPKKITGTGRSKRPTEFGKDLSRLDTLKGERNELQSLLKEIQAAESETKAAVEKVGEDKAAKQASDTLKQLEIDAKSLFEGSRTEAEKYQAQIERIDELYDGGALDKFGGEATYWRLQEQAAQNFNSTLEDVTEELDKYESRALELFESTLTEADKYKIKLEEIEAVYNSGALDDKGGAETYWKLQQDAAEAFAKTQKDVKGGMTELEIKSNEVGAAMESAFSDFLFDPFQDGVKGMARSFADSMRRMAADALATAAKMAILNGLKSQFGISFAHSGGLMSRQTTERTITPKYHSGKLNTNEIPAIIRKDEEVLTPSNPRHVNNQGSQKPLNVFNITDVSMIGDYLDSEDSDEIFINKISRNSTAIKGML